MSKMTRVTARAVYNIVRKQRLKQRRRKEVWDVGKPQGSGDGSPQRGLGAELDEVTRSCRIFKVVATKFYTFLVVFNIFPYIHACSFPCLQASFH